MTADRMAQVDMAGPYYYADIVCLTTAGAAPTPPPKASPTWRAAAAPPSRAPSGTTPVCPRSPMPRSRPPRRPPPPWSCSSRPARWTSSAPSLPTATAAAANDSDLIVLNFAGTDGDFQFASEAERAENVNIGMSVAKGSTELLDAINAVLDGMTADDFNTLMDQAIAVQPEV